MKESLDVVIQLLSILASGGALQFITFLIKRSDNIHEFSYHAGGPVESMEQDLSFLYAPEYDVYQANLRYQEELKMLKSKLSQCEQFVKRYRNELRRRRHS